MNMTRRKMLGTLVTALAAAPMLLRPDGSRRPPEELCSCDMPLASFEEWQDSRPKKTIYLVRPADGSAPIDFGHAVDHLAWSVDQRILKTYMRLTCPVHGEKRHGGPRPDGEDLRITKKEWEETTFEGIET